MVLQITIPLCLLIFFHLTFSYPVWLCHFLSVLWSYITKMLYNSFWCCSSMPLVYYFKFKWKCLIENCSYCMLKVLELPGLNWSPLSAKLKSGWSSPCLSCLWVLVIYHGSQGHRDSRAILLDAFPTNYPRQNPNQKNVSVSTYMCASVWLCVFVQPSFTHTIPRPSQWWI